MAVFWIIFGQELRLNFRHLEKILANFLFFIIFLTVFLLISQNSGETTFIWFALLSCLIFSNSEFLKKDFEDGSLEQIMLAYENFETAIFAKMLVSWISSCLMILPIIFLLKPDVEFLKIIFLASLAINFLCCFCGSLSILANSAPLVAVIILPLIIPILLVAQGDAEVGVKLLSGLVVFVGIIAVFATAKIVKIASE